jgi:hypothetical protein
VEPDRARGGQAHGGSSSPTGTRRAFEALLDAHAPPGAVLPAETDDEVDKIVAQGRSARTTLAAPSAPLDVGCFAVPREQGLGRDEERPPTCSREQPAERREDRPICRSVAKAPVQLTFQDADLVTEHHELDVLVRHGSSR